MESDGVAIEIVAISGTPFPAATNTEVHAWNTKVPSVPPWGMFRQNPFRTGLYPGTPSCGMNFYTLKPCRVFDTRLAAGPLGGPIMVTGVSRDFPVLSSSCGIPATAAAISGNVTVTLGSNGGSLVAYAKGTPLSTTPIIDWSVSQTRANNLIIRLGTGGAITVVPTLASPGTGVHVILDVDGYFR
jgi:hypothetical protein